MARQPLNGDQYADPDQYDFGPEVDEGAAPYIGSEPRGGFAPAPPQQGITARRAVPPKDPATGQFIKNDRRPQEGHPLQQGSYQQRSTRQQYQEQQQQAPEQFEAFEHPRSLLRRAVEVGFTDEEIDYTPSEQLEDLVWQRKGAAMNEVRQQNNFQAMQPQPAAQQPQQQPQQQQQAAPPPEDDENIDFGEMEQLMDAKFVKTLKSRLTSQLKRLKDAEKRLVDIDNRDKEREQANVARQNAVAFANRMDRAFAKHAQYLGEERWDELQPGDPSHVKRQAVLNLAQNDRSNRSDQEKIDRAVATLFGLGESRRQRPQQNFQQQSGYGQQQLSPRQRQWQEGGLQRPTQRRAQPEVNGVRKAIASVTEQLQHLGDAGSNGVADYDDFLGGDQSSY